MRTGWLAIVWTDVGGVQSAFVNEEAAATEEEAAGVVKGGLRRDVRVVEARAIKLEDIPRVPSAEE